MTEWINAECRRAQVSGEINEDRIEVARIRANLREDRNYLGGDN